MTQEYELNPGKDSEFEIPQVNREEAENLTPEDIYLKTQKIIEGNRGYTTIQFLMRTNREDLVRIIHQYYPGGIFALNEALVYDHPIKPKRHRKGNELFLDYLRQDNTQNPLQLKEFMAKVSRNNLIHMGSINRKAIQIFIPQRESLQPGKRIICRPKYDETLGYTWLEGFIRENAKEKQLFSKRFYRGDPNLYNWRGPDIQSLVDWIHGLIPLEKVKTGEISLDNRSKTITLERTSASSIIIQLHASPSVSQFDRVSLIPKQDEYSEWLEVHKIQEDGGITRLLTYRIDRSKQNKLDGSWLGPERERLKEFLEGKLSPDKLTPFVLPVKSGGRFYPIVLNGKSVELHLPPSLFLLGKKIAVVPTVNTEGNLMLSISTDESHTHQKFIFDKQSSKFIKLNELQEPIISPKEANEQLRRLVEG